MTTPFGLPTVRSRLINTPSPRIKKALRRYVAQAYDLELGKQLQELSAEFDAWKSGALTNDDLSDAIHRFHNGAARELYNKYNDSDLSFVVAAAIVSGLLSRDQIEPEVLDALHNHISFLEEHDQGS